MHAVIRLVSELALTGFVLYPVAFCSTLTPAKRFALGIVGLLVIAIYGGRLPW